MFNMVSDSNYLCNLSICSCLHIDVLVVCLPLASMGLYSYLTKIP